MNTKTIPFTKDIKNGMRAIHPGEILYEEFLLPLEINVYDFALKIGVDRKTIEELIFGKHKITDELSMLLGKELDTTPDFWLNLQKEFNSINNPMVRLFN